MMLAGDVRNCNHISACFVQESHHFIRLLLLLLLFRLFAGPSLPDVLLRCVLERGQPETEGSSVRGAFPQLQHRGITMILKENILYKNL
jgi:hypothetical protein